MPSLMLRNLPQDLIDAIRRFGLEQHPTVSPATAAVQLLRRGLDAVPRCSHEDPTRPGMRCILKRGHAGAHNVGG